MDIALPTPTLHLTVIASQPFARTLKILTLKNRRLDVSFALPTDPESDLLPSLEELNLEGCGLRDTVPVSNRGSGAITPPRANERALTLPGQTLPKLADPRSVDNALTAAALQTDVLASLILAFNSSSEGLPSQSTRKGLSTCDCVGTASRN